MGIMNGREGAGTPLPLFDNSTCGRSKCGVRNAECGVKNSAFHIPHSALECLFLHGESEDGPIFSGTYGLRLFSTCFSR